MNILVACEESQAVTIELRKRGNNAFSCDLLECSGGHPEWHIKQSVLPLLNGRCAFATTDGKKHTIVGKWDMIIAFPPCTYLTVTGNRWFDAVKYGYDAQNRWNNRCIAICFFLAIAYADCDRIAIENPIGCMSTYFRKPDQIIHPYYFAEAEDDENCERKSTCLWLKELPPLQYEVKYGPRVVKYKNGKGTDSPWHVNTIGLPKEERSRLRSKTYPGVAKAMAEQWVCPTLYIPGIAPLG